MNLCQGMGSLPVLPWISQDEHEKDAPCFRNSGARYIDWVLPKHKKNQWIVKVNFDKRLADLTCLNMMTMKLTIGAL